MTFPLLGPDSAVDGVEWDIPDDVPDDEQPTT